MKLYHGSNSLFSEFSLDFIGKNAGYSEGAGVYFTPSLETANKYGSYLYTVEFTPGRELSDTELTITPEEYYELIKEMHKYHDYLDNYGEVEYSGLNKLLTMAYECEYSSSSSDSELLAGIGSVSGHHIHILKIASDVLKATHFKGFNFNVDIYPIFDLQSIIILNIQQ